MTIFLFVLLFAGTLFAIDCVCVVWHFGIQAAVEGFMVPLYFHLPGGATYWILVRGAKLYE